jgi:RNA 2',3'-cyclic 3'-phosphodiesterase
MRLFVGLPIPPELARILAQFARALSLADARLIPPAQLHLTLVFLGQIGEDRLPAILRELDQLNVEPVQLRFNHLDLFPRAGVLFAEIESDAKLLRLHTEVSARMTRCGVALDDRPYQPHVTLARLRSHVRLSREQTILPSAARQPFVADVVNLYRSHTLPTGAQYEILAHKPAGRH